MKKNNLLLIDDDRATLRALQLLLGEQYRSVNICNHPEQIPELLAQQSYDAILLDMNFRPGARSGNEGLYWLKRIRAIDPAVGIVLLTAHGEIDLAVQGMKIGAIDFLQKPWDNDRLFASLHSAVQVSNSRRKAKGSLVEGRNEEGFGEKMILGRSPAMQQVLEMVDKVAATSANILLTGEHGTGKSMIARKIHQSSPRKDRPFISVDLGSIAESLFESELFGHAKGAFTGAGQERVGKFEQADGGTLFLDEIGNLSPPLQAKLLVALENRAITRVGGFQAKPIDIRLITATNQSPSALVKKGTFREDLLFRINTVQLELPPLRARADDLFLYAQHYFESFGKKYGKLGLYLSPESKQLMRHYRWPGNVRELRNIIERAVILSDTKTLHPAALNFQDAELLEEEEVAFTLEEMERKMILKAIDQHQGNFSAAAEQLGISRQTLYNKIKKYNL
ncbi:MAG: sigma-54-dependent Fis family transcriptional regulator [Saprospiraceae bacterium]|nr:sigma-54-dependent Fis family transcriptional regulator [Saprospiraceae bacterium]